MCILVYNLEITTICHYFNFDKTYAFFCVNSISPEIMVVSSLGHLERLCEGSGSHSGGGGAAAVVVAILVVVVVVP